MLFDVISSGSKGNCTIVISNGKALLLDFGISKKRVSEALSEYGLSFEDISAFFISHTHSDHASDLFNAPMEKIYSPQPKIPKITPLVDKKHLVSRFQEFHIDGFTITALPMSHDCVNTMGYLIDDSKETLCYVTDTGFIPEKDFPYLENQTYYIFESNHDAKMLYESKRPDYLIKRIISDKGHLSNVDSACYLSRFISKDTREVVLSHLSDECNTPTIALSTFESVMMTQLGYLPECKVSCASEKKETKGGR